MIIAHKYGLKVYPNGSQTWLQVHWEKDNIKKAHFTGNVKCAQTVDKAPSQEGAFLVS